MPFAFALVMLLTLAACGYHASRRDGKASQYGLTAAGEAIGLAVVVLVMIARRR